MTNLHEDHCIAMWRAMSSVLEKPNHGQRKFREQKAMRVGNVRDDDQMPSGPLTPRPTASLARVCQWQSQKTWQSVPDRDRGINGKDVVFP